MALFGRTSEREERRAEEYGDWLRRRNPLAVASFVLGVFSIIEFGALVVPGIAGIILGVVSLVQLRRVQAAPATASDAPAPPVHTGRYEADDTPVPKTHGHALAILGIILSVLSLVIAAALYFRWVGWR